MSQDNDNGFGKNFHFLAFHILLFSSSCRKNFDAGGYQINNIVCCDIRISIKKSKLYWSSTMIEHALFPIHDILWYAEMDKNKYWEKLKSKFLWNTCSSWLLKQFLFYLSWIWFDVKTKKLGRPFFSTPWFVSVFDSKGNK